MSKKTFSILIPVYFNEMNIPHTVPRLQALSSLLPNYDLEFVFVDDGSKDDSLRLLLEEKKNDSRIKVIKLSKNYGSMQAIQAGLTFVTGDCVGIIAADLQDPPELFERMITSWENGKKIVMATREDRIESFSQKLFSNTYYYLMDKFAIKDYPKGGFDFVLIDRHVVEELNRIKEKNTNIMSLIFSLGFEQETIPYVRQAREHGKSRWTFSKKIKLFVDSFVSFSYAPIRFMTGMGFVVAILSFIYAMYTVISYFVGNINVQGWTTLIALITLLLGMIMMMLGIIGEYLWRILDETRKRPGYIVDKVYE
ncbi:glycosyl transferase family 2 [Ureibacillus massiliensis 4400831 = CIP 108448 = CCUG 49529]|uniref:Glycosyl transferase family 2 n=1 Tax=Ureibacillus massiliensis 4400831 = CIP 108448 = CCUG 49529 TaxID=1211035 RepID=A0A0A3IZA0_9BACL|nr:glycosyltransferase family 2 protein [Ureibacillus massiliensis]KGR90036.1 glycosyl transferase family 2 [Ureibacillus massiliensis 4400831 = CIP 108448 = CCUG 49529]